MAQVFIEVARLAKKRFMENYWDTKVFTENSNENEKMLDNSMIITAFGELFGIFGKAYLCTFRITLSFIKYVMI